MTGIQVDYAREVFYAGDAVIKKGDWITIDGSTGEVLEGQVEMLAPDADSGDMATLLGWADEVAEMRVRANADTGHDASSPVSWVRWASASVVRSTCSSRRMRSA